MGSTTRAECPECQRLRREREDAAFRYTQAALWLVEGLDKASTAEFVKLRVAVRDAKLSAELMDLATKTHNRLQHPQEE